METFVGKKKYLAFLLILLTFFSFIKSKDFSIENDEFDKSKQYTKDFDSEENQNYMKIEVQGTDSSMNYIISIFDDSTRTKRIQLGQSFKGKSKMFLHLNQFKDNKIYFDVECPSHCQVSIDYEIMTNIKLNEGEPFSYYVNEGSKNMVFELSTNSKISNIWARGQFPITTVLNVSNKKNYGNYYIVENMPLSVFKVEGTIGDYINVGYMGYSKIDDDIDSSTKLTVDGPILTGFLLKDTLDKICFTIDNDLNTNDYIFGTGNILTKIAYSYSADEDGKIISNFKNEKLVTSGIIKHFFKANQLTGVKQCFTFPDSNEFEQYSKIKEIVFTYQLTKGASTENNFNLYEPQLNGISYPRLISKGSKVAFIGIKNENFKKMTLSLMASNGFPKMHVINCDTYPLCTFDENTLSTGIRPRNINRFSSLTFEKDKNYDNSPISKTQTLFVVECLENHSSRQHFDEYCDFNSLIFKDEDEIELIEDKFFNQFAVKDQEHNYKIKLSKESNIQKIFIDIMTFVGDVEITYDKDKINVDQYIAINKIYLSVKLDKNYEENFLEMNFKVKALSNTYYTVLINFGRNNIDDSLITNELQTGMSYLVTIDKKKIDEYNVGNKIVKFINEKSFDYGNMLVNFYSLNCKIQAGRTYNNSYGVPEYDLINQYEYFLHDVVTPEHEKYDAGEYLYRIKVNEDDPSEYEGKLCKIYASAIELSDEHEDFTRDILIPDNTPQQAKFGENVKHISYGYIHVDHSENDLLIMFNTKHTAKYKIKIFYEYHERESEEIIVANDILYLNHESEWNNICKDKNRVCFIQLDITLDSTKYINDPVLEFSIKSIESKSVAYIGKNILKLDYSTNQKIQYYFTEIGINESGFIIVNFLRGSGKVLGKIVKKNIDENEENANWRGKYRLPNEDEVMKMDPFTKKLSFNSYGYDCEQGCYLLIGVYSDIEGETINIERNYPYSLLVHTYPNVRYDYNVPSVFIPLDQYIIGTIETISSNRILEFYYILFNQDADKIAIDFQSEAAGLFINIGSTKPKIDERDFEFWPKGKDTVFTISKSDTKLKTFMEKYLTIGIWTNLTDSVYTTPYAFTVRLENGTKDDIYRVNSEHKALCNPREIEKDKNYRCLYVIEYDFISSYNFMFLYANLQDKSVFFNIYANYIDSIEYEMGTKESISSYIPNKDNKIFWNKDQTEYLYIDQEMKKGQYLLVSVEAERYTTIELLTSLFIYQDGITPNPSSPQLFMSITDNPLNLNFPEDYMVMVNLICIGGSAEIHWNSQPKNKYYLKGRDDRLSITSEKGNKEHKLVVTATDNIEDGKGFIFIVEYNIRMDISNFDALNLDKSVNYVYIENDLPIIYYAPLDSFNMDSNEYYDIFFSFDKLQNEDVKDLTFYENIPFEVIAYLVKDEDIYKARLIPTVEIEKNYKITGKYDPAIRTGVIRISKDDINNVHFQNYERPYLYLKIDKLPEFKSIRKYKEIGVETNVLKSVSSVPISELSNQFGFLSKNETERTYVIRTNRGYQYMNLQFSCLEDNLSIKIKGREDLTKKFIKYGKSFYYLPMKEKEDETLELIITRNNNETNNEEYFMFQYIYSNEEVSNQYSIENTSLVVEKKVSNNEASYKIKLNPVKNSNNFNLTYIIRAVSEGEMPKKSDVSMKLSKQNVKEYYNPGIKDGKINLEINNITKYVKYIQVIVQIKNNECTEYLSYDLFQLSTEKEEYEKKDDDDDDNKTTFIIFIIIGSIFLIMIIILIFVIMVFNNKNKDLLDQVNKISFSQEKNKDDDDLLLGKND